MNLSEPQVMLWASGSSREGVEEAAKDGAHVESAVKAVLKLGEVAVGVLGKVEGMIGTADGCLQVAQQRVHGLELRQLGDVPPAAGDHTLMLRTDDGRSAKAPQPIGDHGCRGGDVLAGEHGDLFAGVLLL